ncbi:uncharacterized protein LOC134263260 [Saccostrea cucullata]|uniref:uncharacterized protein LOC134263260 n=1 Tax=Saccostrea cuccullata TaxID=36930 RepID=UPI002ED56CAA
MNEPAGARRPARARRLRRQVPAAAGSADQAAQQDALEAEQVAQQDASDTLQPQLVAAVTEQVLKAIREQSAGGPSGEERGRERQRSSRGRKRRRRSSSGSMLDSSSDRDKSDNDSEDSSSSEESDSDDEKQLLSTPISSQVDSKLKNKIWQNKYIDFAKLIPKDDFSRDKSVHLQSMGKSEFKFVTSKSKTAIKSIDQWTTAFLKFLAIYSEKFPNLVPAVIKHGEIVRELASRRTGLAWLSYDRQVRKDIESMSIPWGQLHYEYWVMATTSRQSNYGNQTHNFRGRYHFQNKGGAYKGKRIPQGYCYAFHKTGHCASQNCQYKHLCPQCRKPHSVLFCTWGDQSQTSVPGSQTRQKEPTSTSK